MTHTFPTLLDGVATSFDNESHPATAAYLFDYFRVCLPNPKTRALYQRAATQFCQWASLRGLANLHAVQAAHVAAFIAERREHVSDTTAASELTALRGWFHHLTTEGHLPFNPAAGIKGPGHSRTENKTPGLTNDEAATLLNSIETDTLKGLRDRAMIGLLLHTGCRVGAICAMKVEDFYEAGGRHYVNLHDNDRTIGVHHKAAEYIRAWIEAAGIVDDLKTPLFRSMPIRLRNKPCQLTENPTLIQDAWFMVKARCQKAGLSRGFTNQSFRVTAITQLLESGATLSDVQQIAGHLNARTTAFYDRRSQTAAADLMERINYESPTRQSLNVEPMS